MTNKKKIDELEFGLAQQSGTLVILSPEEVLDKPVPEFWRYVFASKDRRKQKEAILYYWNGYYSKVLPYSVGYMNEQLLEVDCVYNVELNKYYLLYSFEPDDKEDDTTLYLGGNPEELELGKDFWSKMPEILRHFYNFFHDGFYFLQGSGGLLPSHKIIPLDNLDWGSTTDTSAADLSKWYPFYKTEGDYYIALNIDFPNEEKAVIWTNYDIAEFDINFWKEIDDLLERNMGS